MTGRMFSPTKYLYAAVVYLNGHKFYTYLTDDRTLKTNDVVMVPVAGKEPQPAIVAWAREFTAENAPYPPEKTKMILGRADRRTAQLFAGIDLRTPFDISVRDVTLEDGTRVRRVTTASERQALRRQFENDPRFRIVEKLYPEPAPERKGGRNWIDDIEDFNAMMDD